MSVFERTRELGVPAGIYPSLRAANIRTIEALRAE